MKDYAMEFECITDYFLNVQNSPITYSNYYGDNPEMRAILFTICAVVLNNLSLSAEDKEKGGEFAENILSVDNDLHYLIQCISFLTEIKNKLK